MGEAQRRLEVYSKALAEMANQLEEWAYESQRGGWSTHQVDPMRKKAREIWQLLGRLDRAVQVELPGSENR
jgi:hypothetical protein